MPLEIRAAYDEALHCNGNGACFNWDPDDAMCPSWKATRQRRHSPKGRASLLREWLRRLSAADVAPDAVAEPRSASFAARLRNSVAAKWGETDFSHVVKEAMDGCLACKSCAGQCPIKVDIPTSRSKFLHAYHTRYLRPPRDHLVASVERLMPLLQRVPGLYNTVVGSKAGRWAFRRAGLVAMPSLSRIDLLQQARRRSVAVATPEALAALPQAERARSVVLVQDAFTSAYETELVLNLLDLLTLLCVRPFLAPFRPNGKPLHVHGFLPAFRRAAQANAAMLGRARRPCRQHRAPAGYRIFLPVAGAPHRRCRVATSSTGAAGGAFPDTEDR